MSDPPNPLSGSLSLTAGGMVVSGQSLTAASVTNATTVGSVASGAGVVGIAPPAGVGGGVLVAGQTNPGGPAAEITNMLLTQPATSIQGSMSLPGNFVSLSAPPVHNTASLPRQALPSASLHPPRLALPPGMAQLTHAPLSASASLAASQASLAASLQKRRSSTRAVKRKKFDDELVESSLVKTDRRGLKAEFQKFELFAQMPPLGDIAPLPPPEKKKPSKSSSSKRSKRPKPPPIAASTKDLGRWKPQDDLALITNVQQTNDLTAVHLGVKFSCRFTLREIQERWYALLYYPVLSKLSTSAIKQLHPDVIAAVQARTLFSKEEETVLGKVTSSSQPSVETFEKELSDHPSVFHPSRSPKALYNHWLLMKQYHLLPDQSVQPMPRGDHVLNFSDAEDMINDEDLKELRDEALEHELSISDRKQKREIRHLEQELPKWQILVDSVTGISPPDFDNQTLAVLRGRLVRYLMRSREITLGRATKDNPIDVDLALEGPAWKISRRQGVIKLRNNGEFYIANEGKRPIYIDGKSILTNNKHKLNNNSVVEISCLRFIFLINQDLINVIRNEAQKMAS